MNDAVSKDAQVAERINLSLRSFSTPLVRDRAALGSAVVDQSAALWMRCTAPSVGPVTAAAFISTVEEVER